MGRATRKENGGGTAGMRQSRDSTLDDDPMLKGRGTIANTLAQARASLLDPSRPFTPAESANSRSLFKGSEYSGFRPQTSDCYNLAMRPDTSYSREPLSNQAENALNN